MKRFFVQSSRLALKMIVLTPLAHRIPGTGIFTYIYHKHQQCHVGKYTVPPVDPLVPPVAAGRTGQMSTILLNTFHVLLTAP